MKGDSMERMRIISHLKGERPPPVGIKVRIRNDFAETHLRRICEVMLIVAQQDINNWPSDDKWLELLPSWFVKTFQKHTLNEILADDRLWTFGSWLDAVRLRGWEWWSSDPANGLIYLTAYRWPYSIGSLEYLVHTSGASVISITELTQ